MEKNMEGVSLQKTVISASQWVIDGVQSCLPKGCPLPFRLESATFIEQQTALAQVTLFDGLPGILHVSRQSYGPVFSGCCL